MELPRSFAGSSDVEEFGHSSMSRLMTNWFDYIAKRLATADELKTYVHLVYLEVGYEGPDELTVMDKEGPRVPQTDSPAQRFFALTY